MRSPLAMQAVTTALPRAAPRRRPGRGPAPRPLQPPLHAGPPSRARSGPARTARRADGVNRSWLPSRQNSRPSRATVEAVRRDLRNWGRYAKALRCVAQRAPTEVRTPCVGSQPRGQPRGLRPGRRGGNPRGSRKTNAGGSPRTSREAAPSCSVLRAVAAGACPPGPRRPGEAVRREAAAEVGAHAALQRRALPRAPRPPGANRSAAPRPGGLRRRPRPPGRGVNTTGGARTTNTWRPPDS